MPEIPSAAVSTATPEFLAAIVGTPNVVYIVERPADPALHYATA